MAQMTGSYDLMRRQLRPMGRRLRLGDTLLLASRSFWIAAVVSLVLALAGRFVPIPNLRIWVVTPLAFARLCTAASGVVATRRTAGRPSASLARTPGDCT